MKDRNNVEIMTGDIVKIEGSETKKDNGLYLVAGSPGDEFWDGTDHSLVRIGAKGKLKESDMNFWPLISKRQGNPEITVQEPLKNMADAIEFFKRRRNGCMKAVGQAEWAGKPEYMALYNSMAREYGDIIERLETAQAS